MRLLPGRLTGSNRLSPPKDKGKPMATTLNRLFERAGTALKGAVLASTAVGSLTLALAMPAMAADFRPVAAYVPPPYDPWNAFSIGIGGGVDIFRTKVDGYAEQEYWPYNEVYYADTLKGTGGFGTVEIGKDFHNGNIVLGIYGEFNFGRKKDDTSGSYFECFCWDKEVAALSRTEEDCEYGDTLTAGARLTLKNSYGVVGRVGVLLNPQTLLYGLFGYTWQKYTADVHAESTLFLDHGYGPTVFSKSGTIGGVTLGIGAEFLVNAHLSVKGEYRLVKLGAVGEVGGYDQGIYTVANFEKTDDHVFRGVISYKLP